MTECVEIAQLGAALAEAKTITINTWRDAAEFLGLESVQVTVTPLFERVLCRVTARGKALLEDYWSLGGIQLYGTNGEFTLSGEESLGYVSLDRKELMQLAVFCAARSGDYRGFIIYNKTSLVLLPSQRLVEAYSANSPMFLNNAALFEFVPNTRNFTQRF